MASGSHFIIDISLSIILVLDKFCKLCASRLYIALEADRCGQMSGLESVGRHFSAGSIVESMQQSRYYQQVQLPPIQRLGSSDILPRSFSELSAKN